MSDPLLEQMRDALWELAELCGSTFGIFPAVMGGWYAEIPGVKLLDVDRLLIAWGDDPNKALQELWELASQPGNRWVIYGGPASAGWTRDFDNKKWVLL